ncbi:MAG: 1-acyl-sn-glycerol-3-phosphate acyltransferase [Phycisphaerales bacterium]|nr:1-acyl-sn-glycerol-3-phosphate acyltransferase [Phycisphaerae bacterium]NNF42029.1 1-acyl-sn-glycerol-3-phosphate acyltransferase [Phycisphaerales bacterium]NNM25746.1 1-acyl-sn-glycerol-3-phosphate acyltransferase [Phycisphaerales bacterium]
MSVTTVTPDRPPPPTAADIERRFGSPTVRIARPVISAGLVGLRGVCRFNWTSRNLDAVTGVTPPFILASNHASHVDTAAILGTLPPTLRERTCVAAALDVFGPLERGRCGPIRSLRREFLQVTVAAGFRAFAFDRHGSSRRSLRAAVELVRHGWNLLLFPEGTRSRAGVIGPFKAGVAIVAKMTGRPVVPTYVQGGTTVLPCGTTIPRPGRVVTWYGTPLRLADGENAQEFTARVETRVRELACRAAATVPDPPLAGVTAADASPRRY